MLLGTSKNLLEESNWRPRVPNTRNVNFEVGKPRITIVKKHLEDKSRGLVFLEVAIRGFHTSKFTFLVKVFRGAKILG